MSTQTSIAAATAALTPATTPTPTPHLSWGLGLAIAAVLLLMAGCVIGLGVGWWHLCEHRRTQRCLREDAPRPDTPTTTDPAAPASPGGAHPVARSRSPHPARHTSRAD